MPRTMVHDRIGRCLIVCHTTARPGPHEWADYLERLIQADFDHVVISSRGGGPTPAQRGDWETRWKELGLTWPRTALLTESPVPRGILTAWSWAMKVEFKVFLPREIAQALSYLGLPVEHRLATIERIAELHDELDEAPDPVS